MPKCQGTQSRLKRIASKAKNIVEWHNSWSSINSPFLRNKRNVSIPSRFFNVCTPTFLFHMFSGWYLLSQVKQYRCTAAKESKILFTELHISTKLLRWKIYKYSIHYKYGVYRHNQLTYWPPAIAKQQHASAQAYCPHTKKENIFLPLSKSLFLFYCSLGINVKNMHALY